MLLINICAEADEHYRSNKAEFAEGMAEIHNALAAIHLGDFIRLRDNATSQQETIDKCAINLVHHLKRADDFTNVNEYRRLISGFYELRQGWYL